jgi:hypothetical protein
LEEEKKKEELKAIEQDPEKKAIYEREKQIDEASTPTQQESKQKMP